MILFHMHYYIIYFNTILKPTHLRCQFDAKIKYNNNYFIYLASDTHTQFENVI